MSKKRKTGTNKKKGSTKSGKSKTSSVSKKEDVKIDMRLMEQMFGTSEHDFEGMMPVEQAQQIIYSALEQDDRDDRIQLALEALQLSLDCADAYVILAEESASDYQEAMAWYMLGVRAGERALGEETFEEDAGLFWGILETRPYMRARLGLAQCLWSIGQREDAVTEYRVLLDLNPNDNQGVRYMLMAALLVLGLDKEAESLLNDYEDESSAMWAYASVLLSFRRSGDTEQSRRQIEEAVKNNPFVSKYLIGKKKFPKQLPEFYSPGDESEAVECAYDQIEAWKNTDGAIKWLAENT